MKETNIQNAILEYLLYKKIFAWRNNTGAMQTLHGGFYRFGKKGSGDIFAVLPKGRFCSIEVKRKGSYPTHDQKEFMEQVNKVGGLAFVARSIDDVINNIDKLL